MKSRTGHGIISRFTHLLSAFFVREVLNSIFLIYLARKSTTSYGQFMLALSLGQILLLISEFGINQHLVSLLVREAGAAALSRVTALKSGLLTLGGWELPFLFSGKTTLRYLRRSCSSWVLE